MTNRYRIARLLILCLTFISTLSILMEGEGDTPATNCGQVWESDHFEHQCWKVTPQEDDLSFSNR